MKIYPIQTGSVSIKSRQLQGIGHGTMRLVNTLLDQQWMPAMPILAWVIEHPEGLIVVDTGETSRTSEPGYFPRWHPFFRLNVKMDVHPEDEIGPSMKHLGFSTDDVRWVVLTHLHTDHAGGLHTFPKAEVLVSRREYAAAQGIKGRVAGYLPQYLPSWLQPRLIDFEAHPLENFSHSLPLTQAGDVHLIQTNGHSVGHLSVLVRDGGLSYFLAGDTSYTEQYLREQVVDGVSPDEKAASQTLDRILTYAQHNPTVYLPAHDSGSIQRLEMRQTVFATHQKKIREAFV